MKGLEQFKLKVWPPGEIIGPASITVTLASIGVVDASFDQRLGAEDEMQLTFARDFNVAGSIPCFSTIELFNPYGQRIFYGLTGEPRRKVSKGARRHVVRVLGPHAWMDGNTYTASRVFETAPEGEESSESASDISTIVLNRPAPGAEAVSQGAMLETIFARAQADGCPVQVDISNFPLTYKPEQGMRIADHWQLVKLILSQVPNVVAYWDYSKRGEFPTLKFGYAARNPISGTVELKTKLARPRLRPEHCDIAQDSITWTPRDDLLVKTVNVNWITSTPTEIDGRQVNVRRKTTQSSTAQPGEKGYHAPRKAEIDIPLRAAQFDNGTVFYPAEAPPAGNMAEEIHAAFTLLWMEAELPLIPSTTDRTFQVGMAPRLSGWGDDLNDAKCWIVGMSLDVATGHRSIQLGPPGLLQQGTVYDLVKPWRQWEASFDKDDDSKEPGNQPSRDCCNDGGSGSAGYGGDGGES